MARSKSAILWYSIAIFFFALGILYILAAGIAFFVIEQTFSTFDYLGILFWVVLSFSLGSIIIFIQKKQPTIRWFLKRKIKTSKPKTPKITPPVVLQRPPPPDPEEQAYLNRTDLDELKLKVSLGEITQEEYEDIKQILMKQEK